jgi:DNA processing protein
MAPSELLAMAVNRLPFLRPLEKFRLMAVCPGIERFAELSRRDLEEVLRRRFDDSALPARHYLKAAEEDRKGLTRDRFQCTFYWSRDYPPQLREIYDPPLLLYRRGPMPRWSTPMVAIVGTRHPTGRARESSYALAFELAGLGLTTVSGLARGIDAEAHRGSCAAGGRSIAVLGNGIDLLFPGSSAGVGRGLLSAGGVILSEYPPGDPPLARNFPARNRIISGLARTTVVVQAPESSGALITADYALEQGRELVVHRVGTMGDRGVGSRRLAEQGALIIDSASDILEDWGWRTRAALTAGEATGIEDTRDPGKQLARALEAELAGRLVCRSGAGFKRSLNGK